MTKKEEKEHRLKFLQQKLDIVLKSKPHYKKLVDILLNKKGHQVLFPFDEEDFEKIISRGFFIDGKNHIFKKGLNNQCHHNSAKLYSKSKKTIIMTGYALSKDEDGILLWRQNSWAKDKKTGFPIETTFPRILYFGYELNKYESEDFCYFN